MISQTTSNTVPTSDRPEHERDSSAINYSVALKGNLHTDPQRG